MTWKDIVPTNIVIEALNNIVASGKDFCPEPNNVFKAFNYFTPDECRIVFLGQDPYPQKGVATGLLFANKKNTSSEKLSPSLKVLKNSLYENLDNSEKDIIFDSTLENWAKQGILLINSALTVETNNIGSHILIWRPFISKLLINLSNYNNNIIFVLFGSQAQTFRPYINSKNITFEIPHPAYYARINEKMPSIFVVLDKIIKERKEKSINWINH